MQFIQNHLDIFLVKTYSNNMK